MKLVLRYGHQEREELGVVGTPTGVVDDNGVELCIGDLVTDTCAYKLEPVVVDEDYGVYAMGWALRSANDGVLGGFIKQQDYSVLEVGDSLSDGDITVTED